MANEGIDLPSEIDTTIAHLKALVAEYAEGYEGDSKRTQFARYFDWRMRLQEIVGTDGGHGIIKDAAEPLQERLLEEFAEDGTQNWRSTNGVLLYIESRLWANAKPGMGEAACEALVANGFSDFVHPTFNVMTLSAQAREMKRAGQTFPDAVLEHIDLTEKVQIRGRRS